MPLFVLLHCPIPHVFFLNKATRIAENIPDAIASVPGMMLPFSYLGWTFLSGYILGSHPTFSPSSCSSDLRFTNSPGISLPPPSQADSHPACSRKSYLLLSYFCSIGFVSYNSCYYISAHLLFKLSCCSCITHQALSFDNVSELCVISRCQ